MFPRQWRLLSSVSLLEELSLTIRDTRIRINVLERMSHATGKMNINDHVLGPRVLLSAVAGDTSTRYKILYDRVR